MTASIINFFMTIGKLKQLRRTGWLRHHIKDPESVADHMHRMAIMALFFNGKTTDVDRDRCIKLALVHDLAESIVGDITPYCGISKAEKGERERVAIEQLSQLAGGEVGMEILSLWEEYESQATPEAKAVKELDIFDMLLQAYEYEEQEKRPMQLQEFFNGSVAKITSPEVLEWLKELQRRRAQGEGAPE